MTILRVLFKKIPAFQVDFSHTSENFNKRTALSCVWDLGLPMDKAWAKLNFELCPRFFLFLLVFTLKSYNFFVIHSLVVSRFNTYVL